MDERIFECKLYDAWGIPYNAITVYDREKDNVECQVFCTSKTPLQDAEIIMHTLNQSVIRQITDVISDNPEVFKIEDVEPSPVLDGCMNEFYFRNGTKNQKIMTCNIWYFLKEQRRGDEEEPANAKLILKVYGRIKDILVKHGVDEKYLRIDLADWY